MPEVSKNTLGIENRLTSEQVRAARALLRWEQTDLSASSKVSIATVKRLEGQPGPLKANAVTIEALRRALEAAGVEFTASGGVEPRERPAEAS
jgi:hypothetical protein